MKDNGFYRDHLSQYESAQMVPATSNRCPLISFGLLWLTAMLLLYAVSFQTAGLPFVFCQGKSDFGMRSECMNAENLCTTYYLVLLFSMWTPALRCGVYLFTCLCLTLCALHRRSLLCYFHFGWLWWNGYEWAAHFNLMHIGCSYPPSPSCINGCLLGPAPLTPLPTHTFFYILIQSLTMYISPVIQLVKAF